MAAPRVTVNMDAVAEALRELKEVATSSSGADLTPEMLVTAGLSLHHCSNLHKAMMPLSDDTKTGQKGLSEGLRDLTPFWEEVEKCVHGLGAGLNMARLSWAAVSELAPVLLGMPIWSLLRVDLLWHTWDDLKALVEACWGLTAAQMRESFFRMCPEWGEQVERFVLRVEDVRKCLDVSDETTLNVFLPCLPTALRAKLDDLQTITAMMVGKGAVKVSWALNGTHFSEVKLVAGEPPSSQAHFIAHSSSGGIGSELSGPDFIGAMTTPCKLCAMVGRTSDAGHELKNCYASPLSPLCKAAAYRTRVTELLNRGLPIPSYMMTPPKGEGSGTTTATPAPSPAVTTVAAPPMPAVTAATAAPPTVVAPAPTSALTAAMSPAVTKPQMQAFISAALEVATDPAADIDSMVEGVLPHLGLTAAPRATPTFLVRHCQDGLDV